MCVGRYVSEACKVLGVASGPVGESAAEESPVVHRQAWKACSLTQLLGFASISSSGCYVPSYEAHDSVL